MNVAVFCSANDLSEPYVNDAKELARLLAEDGHTLIYGGSDYGLMKVMADGVQQGGGKIVGISTSVYRKYARKNADEMIITKTLGERKALMLERSDVIVMMIGGLGTLDETTEILELKKQSHHDKAVIILNTNNFYDGLKVLLDRMSSEGFLEMGEHKGETVTLDRFVQFVDTPQEVMATIGKTTGNNPTMEVPTSPPQAG